jgi:benzoyl-CoA reductase/2-hydroxyglutaryl-CoA dehydratase subunit BcrC/BadD/HgdB
MALIDYVKKFPRAIYPYYYSRSFLQGLRAMAVIHYYALKRGEKPFDPDMIKNRERDLFKLWMEGRPPDYQVAIGEALALSVDHYVDVFCRMAREPDKLIWYEDVIPPEIIQAMDLIPFMVEGIPGMAPMVAPEEAHRFIDVAENAGYPADICSMPKVTLGMVLEGLLPPPRALICSNSPCDSGMSSYLPIEQKVKVPVHRVDFPWDVYEPRAGEYCLKEVEGMIRFLEEIAGHPLDMDRLRDVCETRNRMQKATLELWELMKSKPSPMGGMLHPLSHTAYQVCPGTAMGVRIIEKILEVAKDNHREGRGLVPEEKHRAIMWGAFPVTAPDLYEWLEDEYGMVTVMVMLTYDHHPLIDTSSEASMMRDLVEIMSKPPMARHTRGPVENFLGDLFRLYEDYQADLVIMGAHQSCKNMRAVLRILRESCRQRDIPLLILDHDVFDARVVSPEGIKRQVSDFMDTVMGAD